MTRLLRGVSLLCAHLTVVPRMNASSSSRCSIFVTASAAASPLSNNVPTPTTAPKKKYKLLQVQVVHRHGDRTPITPMKNETFWRDALPQTQILDRVAAGTTILSNDDSRGRTTHSAGGRGPFGQLTQLGLLQMIGLGSKLREELLHLDEEPSDNGNEHGHVTDEHGNQHVHRGRLFHERHNPIRPHRIKVTSTNFPRTVQSVQGLLVGLFPDGIGDENIEVEIDARHTDIMIPDPQPRRSEEQVELERVLASRPHLAEREEEMKELAVRATDALRDVLGSGFDEISFGVGEEKEKDDGTTTDGKQQHASKPLPWAQLSEITTCLRTRDMLPPSITDADQEAISSHAAWRWFENLRHPRLAKLAMHDMVSNMVEVMHRGRLCPREGKEDDEPLLHIYSAHDSTLIGLLCALRLEQPSEWPEYGSYLKMELIEVEEAAKDEDATDDDDAAQSMTVQHYVRFSLNGETLRSFWGTDENGESVSMIPLDHLTAMVHGDHLDG